MPNVVPHIGPGVQGHLNLMPSDRLPKSVVGDIFSKAKEQSILMTLGRQIPVGINETVISVGDIFPEAGQVGGTTLASREGATKPVAGIQYGTTKSFMPIKLAVIVTVSEEYARTNIDGLYSQLTTQLSGAIARAADLAVFHGKDALRGTNLVGISNNKFINATTNRVELNMRRDADPDFVDQVIAGWKLVTDDEDKNFDFTRFAAVPSLRADLVTKRDENGSPIFVPGAYPGSGTEINLNANIGSLLGVPTTFANVVHGKIGNNTKTNVKMFGGDWSQLAYGYADQIRVKISDSASLDDGNGGVISLWQTNQLAVLAEATFGWYVNDLDAFVAYENAVTDA